MFSFSEINREGKVSMPIKKFSSFEEARQDLWVFTPDTEYYKRLRTFYRFVDRLTRPHHVKGIFKYRNIEEMQKQKGSV